MNNYIAFIFLFCSLECFALDLEVSVPYDKGVTLRTDEQREASYVVYDALKEAGVNVYTLNSLTNLGGGSTWFAFSSDKYIYSIDVAKDEVLGRWPLTSGIWGISNKACPAGCETKLFEGRWSKDELFEPEVIERFNNYDVSMRPVYNPNVKTLGCLGDVPLKYGDVEGDGKNELVIFIEDSLIIFSPQHNKTIFMSMIDVKDWYDHQQTIEHFSFFRKVGAPLEPKDPQFQSRLATFVRGGDRSNKPGYRGYAKLFFGDFDGDEKADIIVWRKLYESRLVGDPISGFRKLSDTFAHYTLIGGEYALQKTESSLLREWLTDSQLRWSDGFPSKSECESNKGQLIPEMHDRLLNDPDVLPLQ